MEQLFKETEEIIKQYKKEVEKKHGKREELSLELEKLQDKHTLTLLDQQGTDDIKKRLKLSKQAKEILDEIAIVNSVMEDLDEDLTGIKVKYAPMLQEALRNDYKVAATKYNANSIVTRYRYAMLSEIAEIGFQMQERVEEIAPDISEIFNDPKVGQVIPQLSYAFNRDHWVPTYAEARNTVVSRYDVFNSLKGTVPSDIPRPDEEIR